MHNVPLRYGFIIENDNITHIIENDDPTTYSEAVMSSDSDKWLNAMEISYEPSWIDPLVVYLKDRVLPPDAKEARKLKNQASRYILYEGKLYKGRTPCPF